MGMPDSGGRVFLDQRTIAGLNYLVYAEYDYTHPDVADEFYKHISVLKDILERTTNSTTPLTQADVDKVNAALAGLQDLAINGLTANSTANLVPPVVTLKKYFLTVQMATNLDLLLRSFLSVGATGSPPVLSLAQLTQWKDLSAVSTVIPDIISASTYAAKSNRSLQSLIELEYVRTGSELIGDKLSGLNDALSLTQDVLNSLANLQDFRNRLVTPGRTGYLPPMPTSAMLKDGKADSAALMSAYRKAASAYFNAPLVPQVSSTLISGGVLTSAGQALYSNLLMIQKSLLNFLPLLSATLAPSTLADSNSLYSRIKKITSDFSTMFQAGGAPAANLTAGADRAKALQTFLLDNNVPGFMVPGRNPGDAQSNLNFGITSGQALNDTQKEDVRRFINVFEEFYKSASFLLQAISQIIEKMAQNIGR